MRKTTLGMWCVGAVLASGCAGRAESDDGAEEVDVGSVAQGAQVRTDAFMLSAPAVASSEEGRYDIFAQALGSSLFYRTYGPGNAWSDWVDLSSDGVTRVYASGKPAAVSRSPRTLDVFVRGTDGGLYWRSKSVSGAWGRWKALGGSLASGPAVVTTGSTKLRVFAQGTDNRVLYRSWDMPLWSPWGMPAGDGWSEWRTLTGTITASPAAVSWNGGRIELFARSTDNQLWSTKSLDDGATFDLWWTPLGGVMGSGPAVAAQRDNKLEVYYRGTGGDVMATTYADVGGWDAHRSIDPALIRDEPAVVTVPGKDCDMLFARTPINKIWHRGCGEVSTVELSGYGNPARFEQTLGEGQTYAFNAAMLGDQSSPYPYTLAGLDARWPRELFFFDGNRYSHDPAKTVPLPWGETLTLPPWNAGSEDIQYANLPADTFSLGFRPNVASARVSRIDYLRGRPASAARLVDHGTCSRRQPYEHTWATIGGRERIVSQGVYRQLYDILTQSFSQLATAAGGDGGLTELHIEPSYVTPYGSVDPTQNDDGFSIALKGYIVRPTPFCTARFDYQVTVSYKVSLVDGMLAITPIDHVASTTSGDGCYDFGSFFVDIGRFMMEIPHLSAFDITLPPSSSDIREQLRTTFATTLPSIVRRIAIAQSSQGPAVGLCRMDTTDRAAERASCATQGRENIALATKAKLLSMGWTDAAAGEKASALAAGLMSESFDCLQAGDPADPAHAWRGACRWHPYFRRVNVLPDELELVWHDGPKPSADLELARIFAPAEAVCSGGPPPRVGPKTTFTTR